jgi:hypothetical protein
MAAGRGEQGRGEKGEKSCLLNPESSILNPNPMVDVGFLQEFYFSPKISKNYLLTPKT